jgi:hypothetical protein
MRPPAKNTFCPLLISSIIRGSGFFSKKTFIMLINMARMLLAFIVSEFYLGLFKLFEKILSLSPGSVGSSYLYSWFLLADITGRLVFNSRKCKNWGDYLPW